ncbi:hypothetical protein [Melissococcus plutonius]|uniref:Phage protein n=1 Tax=Melissococcus plutonius (strain ATCC 35311 / DSM 29964 / CIP 104052 / LMG 20360 / NCIMB 702443) TaxID=940190 RepID=F3YBI1_MELPT|nr:hypothetical protein [Melissococcus plutonius]KMT33304.1 hypothetical protein MEPL6_1c03400 [Melissococcus plutonius]KMT33650.1 hypothetical protein MEPL8_7c00890 [Melissococcus plutonius]KMT38988.1 hypothetical protein MEPL12_5c00920 [Melissococcus plutonius]MBB5177542.1 hypothetical protein [Melissococcus plutonius]BAK21859.1 hypothetical protein MPTP_1430 [Melissococcus plutonius ATCC 35311]
MTMTKEAIQYLAEQGIKPEERLVKVGDGRLLAFDSNGKAIEILPNIFNAKDPLEINTLSGFVKYVRSNLDRNDQKLIVHVKNEAQVFLKGLINTDGSREILAIAQAIIPGFEFNSFMGMETFNIALQSKFVPNNDRHILLQVVGNVSEKDVKNTGYDGVIQAVTINQGVATKADVKVPNPVTLAPYRTFLEVEQPESQFIFRMTNGPRGAIFEADGGAWRNEAIVNIREYLKEELAKEIESRRITILA